MQDVLAQYLGWVLTVACGASVLLHVTSRLPVSQPFTSTHQGETRRSPKWWGMKIGDALKIAEPGAATGPLGRLCHGVVVRIK